MFGEVTYDLTATLEATVGVRVSSLEQYFEYTQGGTDDTLIEVRDLAIARLFFDGDHPRRPSQHSLRGRPE